MNDYMINCPTCGGVKAVVKWGGIICSKCRVILVEAYTDEYRRIVKAIKEKTPAK